MKITRALALLLALPLLGLVLLAFPAPAARAASVIRVTTTGGLSPCGFDSAWANPCTLDAALGSASPGDEIWVAAGAYIPTVGVTQTATFQLPLGVAIYGGFAGGETSLSQRNFITNVTILSGDIGVPGDPADNAFHVVTGSGTNSTAILDGFTITGGNANASSDPTDPNNSGAGMYNNGGSPTLANLIFSNNSAAAGYGGGISNNNSSSPALTNVTFSSNSANVGGGMDNQVNSNPTLSNVTFSGNSASLGGGMHNYSSSPTLTHVTFSSNPATYGGGIYNYNSSSPTLTNVTFSNNSATQQGGGIYNDSNSSPTLANVTFFNNSATVQGGGMYSADSSTPTVSSTTFYSNSATIGGGMDNESSSSPTITNTTFISNTASQYGGGMYTWSSNPTLTNVTFANNAAGILGGGMDNESSGTTIRNAVFWNNSAPSGSQIYVYSSTPSVSNSVMQDGCPAGSACASTVATDPLLGALGNYGGNTQTLPLLPGSSAIDAGNDLTCPGTDQRGIARPQGAHCDVGAFESRRFTLTKTSGDNQSTLVDSAFATQLRVTVSSGHGEPVNNGVVNFSAPLSGASAIPVTSTLPIASGAVTLTLTANAIGGSYAVSANTAGAIGPVTFTLTNTGVVFDSYLPLLQR